MTSPSHDPYDHETRADPFAGDVYGGPTASGAPGPFGASGPYAAPGAYGTPGSFGAPGGGFAPPPHAPPFAPPYPPPMYPPPMYPSYPMAGMAAPTNTMAVLSLVFAFVFAPLGIVFGHIAKSQIRRTGEAGDGLALAGLIISYVFTVLSVLIFALLIVFSVAVSSAGTATPA